MYRCARCISSLSPYLWTQYCLVRTFRNIPKSFITKCFLRIWNVVLNLLTCPYTDNCNESFIPDFTRLFNKPLPGIHIRSQRKVWGTWQSRQRSLPQRVIEENFLMSSRSCSLIEDPPKKSTVYQRTQYAWHLGAFTPIKGENGLSVCWWNQYRHTELRTVQECWCQWSQSTKREGRKGLSFCQPIILRSSKDPKLGFSYQTLAFIFLNHKLLCLFSEL